MEPTVEKRHIEVTPGVCGGRPRIAGHRIRVQDIVLWTEQGQSPDQIVADFPQLSLGDVYAALAYYHDHRDEIDGHIREDDQFVPEMKSRSGGGLLERLRASDVQEARARDVQVGEDSLLVELMDGRTLTVPLAWYPRFWYGSAEELAHCELIGDGSYIHWPDLDEDLSIAGMLAGRRSKEGPESLKKWLAQRERKTAGPGG